MYIKHELYAADIADIAAEHLPWERLAGKNLLLTGASGLVGTVIVDVLIQSTAHHAQNRLAQMRCGHVYQA